MKVYADTSFIVSLYKAETTSPAAAAMMGRLQVPVWLSPLGELELQNAFQLSIFRDEIDASAAILKKQLFAEDLAKGVFAILPVPATTLYPKAIEVVIEIRTRVATSPIVAKPVRLTVAIAIPIADSWNCASSTPPFRRKAALPEAALVVGLSTK